MADLLPCPFCGGEAEQDFQQAYRAMQTGRIDHGDAVYCTGCNANMIMCRGDHPELSDDERMAVMVEDWNRRTPTPQRHKPSPGNQTITGETARGERCELPPPQSNVMSPHAFEPTAGDGCGVCGRGPNYTAHHPAGAQHVPCPCTLIEQDEDCPVGYPSMICGICEGRGHATPEKVTALACEMIKIACDLGEPEDPFAAWESIALIKSQHEQMRKALAVADQFITNGIELGYIRMPDPDSNDSALLTPGIVRAALAITGAP